MATKNVVKTELPAEALVWEAEQDYLAARVLAAGGVLFGGRIGLFGQSAVEKFLKAISVRATQTYLEVHQLRKLAEFIENIDPIFKNPQFLATIDRIDRFEQVGRYGPFAKFDPLSTPKAKGFLVWTDQDLHDLDEVVKALTQQLPRPNNLERLYANVSIPFSDPIMWKGTPLRAILVRNNRAFPPGATKLNW